MSNREKDLEFDIAQSLGKIETKIDALNESVSKVVFALLAIVAATVGVEFLPRSPIDWYGATLFTQRFFSIASMFFLSIMLIKTSKNGKSKERRLELAVGLISLSIVLCLGTFVPGFTSTEIGFYIGTLFRIVYTVEFARYAWCLRLGNGS